jgi:diguanylate cyclase (GGDEF)-like protein
MESERNGSSVERAIGIKEARAMAEILALGVTNVGILCVVTASETLALGCEFEALVSDGSETAHARITKRVRVSLQSKHAALPTSVQVRGVNWKVLVDPLRSANGDLVGALVVARVGESWSARERTLIRSFTGMLNLVALQTRREEGLLHQQRLDDLVSRVAERLMSASIESRIETLNWTCETLAKFIEADVAFLRSNDHKSGLSVLEAEWPDRNWEGPDRDPLGAVRFDSDPVFAALQHLDKPFFLGDEAATEDYMERVEAGAGVPQVAGGCVPLLTNDTTWGILGFLHFREHVWAAAEVRALQAVASMLVQLQGRFDADARTVYNANHDELTGLPNRRALIHELETRLAGGRPTTVMVVDLDRFKIMNDFLGHASGDRLLMTMADRLRTSVRSSDIAARLGGDEFVVLLDDVKDSLEATSSAQRLLDLIGGSVEISGQMVSHTASIGIALSVPGVSRALDLLSQADVAMYSAKENGRNQAVVFDGELRDVVNEKSRTELELAEAIETGGLRLHFQPEVDLRTGELLGVEALVRWQHPVRGMLNAAEFITIAEETGLVTLIGRWVFEASCQQLQEWTAHYPSQRFAVRVNMSPADFKFNDLATFVESTLAKYRIDPSRLCIEITEHAVLGEPENTAAALERFRALGVEVAIDDFGTGFASMTELKHLPVDFLKLDMSFVRGITTDRYDRAIVESICLLAKSLGLGVIGEGIEDATLVRELLLLGCHRGQGYLIAKPMSAEDLAPIIANGGVGAALLTDGRGTSPQLLHDSRTISVP